MPEIEYERISIEIERLRLAGRVPSYADVYDPRFDIIKRDLSSLDFGRAIQKAIAIEKDDAPAGFVAWEIIKHAGLQVKGRIFQEYADQAADKAAAVLRRLPSDSYGLQAAQPTPGAIGPSVPLQVGVLVIVAAHTYCKEKTCVIVPGRHKVYYRSERDNAKGLSDAMFAPFNERNMNANTIIAAVFPGITAGVYTYFCACHDISVSEALVTVFAGQSVEVTAL